MLTERVIWTTLPWGFDSEGRLRISLHVAPRLTTDDGDQTIRLLKDFKFFPSWPDRLAHLTFTVEMGGITLQAQPISKPDASLWSRVFPWDTGVRPHAFQDHAKRNIHVFPVRDILNFLTNTYGGLAAAGPELPSIDDDVGPLAAFAPLGNITTWIRDSQSFYEELDRALKKAGTIDKNPPDGKVVIEHIGEASLSAADQQAQNTFFQAYRFYYRPGSQRPDLPLGYIEPSPKPPDFEFHEIVSLVADHPVLLRSLGLVVDLSIDLAGAPTLPSTGTVRAIPHGDLPEAPPRCPTTNYELDGNWFAARPKHAVLMQRGLVNLTPEFWDLFQVDVDGAALQAVGFADTLGRMRDPGFRNQDTPDKTGAPALHSGGLALARHRRGDQLLLDLKDRSNKNQTIESGSKATFDAEDLIRGYRVDVMDLDWPGGPRWFSLHDRTTLHSAGTPGGVEPPTKLAEIHDEGYMKSTAASSERKDHPSPSDDLYLHETVVGWDGWSLAAPRPGKPIVEPGKGDGGGSVARIDPSAGQKAPLLSVVSVGRKSLPRLRVGHRYKFRMRTVDLAGNSRPFSDRTFEPVKPYLESEPVAYLRLQPVPSPTVLRCHLDTEGESLEHLVIRSNDGVSPEGYAARDDVQAALADKPYKYTGDSNRHVTAPKGSAHMAEQENRLEAAFGGTQAQVNQALWLALREEGTFLDPKVVDTASGQKTIDQSSIVLFPPGASLPTDRGAGLSEGAGDDAKTKLYGAYAYYPDAQVVLPYLPDPMAIGVAITGYDLAGKEVFHVEVFFPGSWPTLTPFRIGLSEDAKASEPAAATLKDGILKVTLKKAEVVRAKLSSVFPAGRLEDFAIWNWMLHLTPTPSASQVSDLAASVLAGRHWLFTPHRWLTFTHAVQQPLATPDMTKVGSSRTLGATYADFDGPIANHAKSTGRLDVFAVWSEDVDLVTSDEPKTRELGTAVSHSAHAFGFNILWDEDAAEVTRPELGRISRQEFGDTKYRGVTYHSVATTRFREYLPAAIASVPDKIQQVEQVDVTTPAGPQPNQLLIHDVPSSARPAAADLMYAVPTFHWQRDDQAPVRTHVRRGNGIRLWLRRPWFSSGDGEQLGVLLEPGFKLPRGWRRPAALEQTLTEAAVRPPFVSRGPLTRTSGAGPRADVSRPARRTGRIEFHVGALAETQELSGKTSSIGSQGFARAAMPPRLSLSQAPKPTGDQLRTMLAPYVTRWGNDPVWNSQPTEEPPTVAAFPDHISYATGLTLEEISPYARVTVAGHSVHWDKGRGLWYCDVTIDAGGSYYPFVRLALARFQPISLPDAHLSRVTVADFMQLVPDRTAQVQFGPNSAAITVNGFSGQNYVAMLSLPPTIEAADLPTKPNTTMRAALQRRLPNIPGDLGWELLSEITLTASASGFNVTWAGVLPLPEGVVNIHQHRVLITEAETFIRDWTSQDPPLSTSQLDFLRERVVYADSFEL